MCLAVVHQDPDHLSNQLGGQVPDEIFAFDEYMNSGWIDATGGLEGESSILFLIGYGQDAVALQAEGDGSKRRNLLSEDEVDGMCSEGKLGMAHCDHPGSYWYNTGGKDLLSALCWDQGTPTAMSVDETCTGMRVLNTTMTGDLTTSETFMILGSN